MSIYYNCNKIMLACLASKFYNIIIVIKALFTFLLAKTELFERDSLMQVVSLETY
jgi:hypothetical protein